MTKFRLIGRTTTFTVTAEYLAGGFIPAVEGVTADGRYVTRARVADVIALEG